MYTVDGVPAPRGNLNSIRVSCPEGRIFILYRVFLPRGQEIYNVFLQGIYNGRGRAFIM